MPKGQGKRLSQEEKAEIIASKGKIKAKDLAEKYGVSQPTIYSAWTKSSKPKAKKRGAVAKSAPVQSKNPNQQRIAFCKRWIGILQEELKRLESEPDLLKEAEAILTKVIASK